MEIKPLDLIDFEEVNKLLEGFNQTTGFVTAILDLDGKVLSKSGWRTICTEFHRVHPDTARNCGISDTDLANQLEGEEKYHFYQCLNGLVDVAVPIIIKGEHVANLFSGQFFFEEPNRTFFEKQAEKFGFNKQEYLEALDKVPIVSKEKVKVAMDFLLNMTQLISEITYQKTEQTLLNKALHESEFRFDKLYENGPFGMVLANMDFHFKKANPAFCAITGYTEAELQKMTFKDISHPDDILNDLPNIKKLIQKEISVYKTEKRYIRKDGQTIWGSLTVTATFDSEGQFLYNLGMVEDITSRKNAEDALTRLNDRISTATRASQVGIWDWDILNNVLSWDDQMYALYGLKNDLFYGAYQAWFNGLHPDDKDFSQLQTQLALDGEKDYDTEFRVVWPDGAIRHIRAKGEVFRDATGQPARMVGINYDITQQKEQEEKIRKKDQEFRKLSANVPDLIYQFTRKPDGSYCVPIASEGIRNIFGCSPEDVVDDFTPIGRVIYPEDAERVLQEIEYSAAHLTYFTCEFRVQIPGRDLQWILSNSTPERLPDGSITWYGFNVDITRLKKGEKALKDSEEKFRKAFAINPDAITITRQSDGMYISANNGFTQIFGYTEDEVLGKTSLEIDMWYSPEDRKRFVAELSSKGIVENFEARLFTKNKKEVEALVSSAIIDFEGIPHILSTTKDITELKKIQESLRASEEKLRAIFDVLPFGISLIDNDRSIAQMNPVLEKIIKLNYKDIADGKHKLRKYLRSDGTEMPPTELASLRAIDEDRVVQDVETGILTEDGDVFWTSVSAAPLHVKGLSAVVITQDINDRKHAEEHLRYNEELLMEVGHIAQVGGWEYSVLTGKSSWTEEVARIHDLDPTTPASVDLSLNYYTESSKPIIEKAFSDALTNAKSYDLELEIITAKGNHKWIRTIGHPVVVDGELLNVRGSIQDITERKLIENSLRESEEKFRMLLESIPLPVAYSNSAGEIVFRNERFLQVIGYTQEEIPTINEWWLKAYPDEVYRKWVIDNWSIAVSKAIEFNTDIESEEYRITCKDGVERIIIIAGILINDNLLNTFIDITDRKHAEEEVIQLNETLEHRVEERTSQLEAANKEMEAFSYSVSHDLRAPLRHINGYVDLLTNRFNENLPEKAQYYLSTISSAANQMGTLIDDLLQFSRTNRQELRKTRFDMNVLIAESMDKIKPDLKNRTINWKIQDLPTVFGDYSLLKQVWVNLLDNAVKYTKLKDVAEIAIEFREEKDYFVFFIRDNGVGFDMKFADKLFGVFQRLHAQSEFEGTGIGLANVQRIVYKHNGKVWAEAEPNIGATFFFSLPKR